MQVVLFKKCVFIVAIVTGLLQVLQVFYLFLNPMTKRPVKGVFGVSVRGSSILQCVHNIKGDPNK